MACSASLQCLVFKSQLPFTCFIPCTSSWGPQGREVSLVPTSVSETVYPELNFSFKLCPSLLACQCRNMSVQRKWFSGRIHRPWSRIQSYSYCFQFVPHLCEQEFIANLWQTDLYCIPTQRWFAFESEGWEGEFLLSKRNPKHLFLAECGEFFWRGQILFWGTATKSSHRRKWFYFSHN